MEGAVAEKVLEMSAIGPNSSITKLELVRFKKKTTMTDKKRTKMML